jgi:hypothetical protein
MANTALAWHLTRPGSEWVDRGTTELDAFVDAARTAELSKCPWKDFLSVDYALLRRGLHDLTSVPVLQYLVRRKLIDGDEDTVRRWYYNVADWTLQAFARDAFKPRQGGGPFIYRFHPSHEDTPDLRFACEPLAYLMISLALFLPLYIPPGGVYSFQQLEGQFMEYQRFMGEMKSQASGAEKNRMQRLLTSVQRSYMFLQRFYRGTRGNLLNRRDSDPGWGDRVRTFSDAAQEIVDANGPNDPDLRAALRHAVENRQ